MINEHKPLDESNDDDTDRAEWKIRLAMQNSCICIKNFEDTCTTYSASKPAEIFMGSDTKYVVDKLFDTTLERFQQAIETSDDNGSEFTQGSVGLLYY